MVVRFLEVEVEEQPQMAVEEVAGCPNIAGAKRLIRVELLEARLEPLRALVEHPWSHNRHSQERNIHHNQRQAERGIRTVVATEQLHQVEEEERHSFHFGRHSNLRHGRHFHDDPVAMVQVRQLVRHESHSRFHDHHLFAAMEQQLQLVLFAMA